MTDATATDSAQDSAEPTEPAGAEEQPPEPMSEPQEPAEPESEKRGNAEAAKYRTQLRAAEAAIADHESHIAELQQYVIAGLISGKVADPNVFAKLVDRDAWAGEDGRIDLNKLDTAVERLLTDHPTLKPTKAPPRMKPTLAPGTPVADKNAPRPLSAIDKAFPKSGATMQNLLERRPEAGSVGDTIRERGKNRRIRGRIGGEDD